MIRHRIHDHFAVATASAALKAETRTFDCGAGRGAFREAADASLVPRVPAAARAGVGRRARRVGGSALPALRRTARIAVALLATALLGACASAPKMAQHGIPTDRELAPVRAQPHARADRFLDVDAMLAARSATLPRVIVADGAAGDDITPAQAALVANRAARDVCNALAPHLELVERGGDLDVELRLIALQPTSRGVAGVSEVIGYFAPVSVRLPVGLGGLAIDGLARSADGDVLVLRWAEGANALTESALISTIGDAYQLANEFADDFADAVVDPRGRDGETRRKLDRAQREANKALCRDRFGSRSVAGLGASFLLPLAPEMLDEGAPGSPGTAIGGDGRKDGLHD